MLGAIGRQSARRCRGAARGRGRGSEILGGSKDLGQSSSLPVFLAGHRAPSSPERGAQRLRGRPAWLRHRKPPGLVVAFAFPTSPSKGDDVRDTDLLLFEAPWLRECFAVVGGWCRTCRGIAWRFWPAKRRTWPAVFTPRFARSGSGFGSTVQRVWKLSEASAGRPTPGRRDDDSGTGKGA